MRVAALPAKSRALAWPPVRAYVLACLFSTSGAAKVEPFVRRGQWQAGGTAWEETPFSRFWDSLPDARAVELDGFKVSHRHAMWKLLIDCPAGGGDAVWGGKECNGRRENHWLWAYAAQLDWQQSSGRLSAPTNAPTDNPDTTIYGDRISVDSWFGGMNFCFCVCMLQGAADAGVVPQPRLTAATVETLSLPNVKACTAVWERFWRTDHAELIAAANAASATLAADELDRELERLREEHQRRVWEAHSAIIDAGLAAWEAELLLLPKEEQDLGLG